MRKWNIPIFTDWDIFKHYEKSIFKKMTYIRIQGDKNKKKIPIFTDGYFYNSQKIFLEWLIYKDFERF